MHSLHPADAVHKGFGAIPTSIFATIVLVLKGSQLVSYTDTQT